MTVETFLLHNPQLMGKKGRCLVSAAQVVNEYVGVNAVPYKFLPHDVRSVLTYETDETRFGMLSLSRPHARV